MRQPGRGLGDGVRDERQVRLNKRVEINTRRIRLGCVDRRFVIHEQFIAD